MKNLFLLPTSEPSRLFKDDNQVVNLHTHPVLKGIFTNGIGSNQHIYITSSEEIIGLEMYNWVYNNGRVWLWQSTMALKSYNKPRKIILTNDPKLIAYGVQAIDEDFLQWFVNNPSCDDIKVGKEGYKKNGMIDEAISYKYKIIVPKEHPKTFKELFANTGIEPTTDESGNIQYTFKANMKEEPKQEEDEIYDISDHDGIGNAVDNLNNEEPKQELPKLGTDEFNSMCGTLFSGKPKQETLEETPKECYFIPSNNSSSATICGNCGKEKMLHTIGSGIKVSKSVIITKEEQPKQETMKQETMKQETMKQETLEEILGSEYYPNLLIEDKLAILYRNQVKIHDAIVNINNQQMYSEKEVLELLHKRMIHKLGADYMQSTTINWFERFKKK